MRIFVGLLGFLMSSSVFALPTVQGEHVRISWLAPQVFSTSSNTKQNATGAVKNIAGSGGSVAAAAVQNATEKIGIRFQIDPHWHVYWKNPGDSGAAPKFNFQNTNVEVGEILWPPPERLPVNQFVNLGYEQEVVFPFEVTTTAAGNTVNIEVKLEWLVCQEECIPGFGTLTLQRPRTHSATSTWKPEEKKKLAEFLARVPKPAAESPWTVVSLMQSAEQVVLKLQNKNPQAPPPQVFPVDLEYANSQPPQMEKTEDAFHFDFQLLPEKKNRQTASFLVVDADGAWELQANVQSADQVLQTGSAPASLWILLGLAFLGGIILNLMPCVLPVLSIKFLSLARVSENQRLRESVFYTLGVLVTFALLGAAFLALRHAGVAAGWGFQLQSKVVILILISLFWLMGLNFLGVFEWGSGVMSWAGRFQNSSSFVTGVLSVFVAAPCTGPFMGTALGAAATLPAWQSMAIFLSLGLGLASPFLVLAVSPRAFKWLPKPGAWMETLKQFLAFPMFATVLWLLWVLGHQAGIEGWFLAALVLFLISFCLWFAKVSPRKVQILIWILALSGLSFALIQAKNLQSTSQKTAAARDWVNFDQEKINQARMNDQPVFVDFTAAWCITCQVNKKAVLETEAAAELFRKNNVLIMRGDWTNNDEVITQALAAFNRNSVPLYVYYPPGKGEAHLLPQILTIKMIEDLFNP